MQLKPGARVRSAVCATEVVVVRAPAGDVDLWCGGVPTLDLASAPSRGGGPVAGQDEGTLLGKRYSHDATGLEVLCTKSGAGTLSVAGEPLGLQQAKPLPSSD
ncbi:MAG TPA: hypothetical protein VHU85_16970 [Acidimicrobiales bacterium]|nr:hypothetical protein [Acidimicrobiales bacterium]